MSSRNSQKSVHTVSAVFDQSRQWQGIQTSQVSHMTSIKKMNLNHSDKLPDWLMNILSCLLGIKRNPHDKPIAATIIYTILLLTSITYGFSTAWIVVYNIKSPKTRSNIFNCLFQIILNCFWCCISVYAYGLTSRVLRSDQLVKNIRLHTRTILKINTGILVTILCIVFCGVYGYKRYTIITAESHANSSNLCELIDLPAWLCYVNYSATAFHGIQSSFWNLVLLISVLSVTRTQTIIIRRFIRELEFDSKVLQKKFLNQHEFSRTEQFWASVDAGQLYETNPSTTSSQGDLSDGRETYGESHRRRSQLISENNLLYFNETNETELPHIGTDDFERPSARAASSSSALEHADIDSLVLTADELYFRHSILQRTMLHISLVFQRWVSSWIVFVVLWQVSYVVEWLAEKPHFMDIILFVIPLVMLLLICSGYAEVNNECQGMLRFMYGRDNRLAVYRFYVAQPIQIGVFNTALTYTLILSVLLALGVALLSRIIMDIFQN